MNLNYSYKATEDANIKYKYKIVGVLGAYYTSNGVEQRVWEKEYELKQMSEEVLTKGKEIKINELVNVKLDSYNKEIASFEKEFGMPLKSNLLIQMEVFMDSKVDDIKFDNNYFTNIQIGLGGKTTQVQGDLQEVEKDIIKQEYTRIETGDIVAIIIYIGIIAISALCLRFVIFNTKSINVLKNSYKAELNRILKPNGSIWVIGGMQCIYTIGAIMQRIGFWLINDVIWYVKTIDDIELEKGTIVKIQAIKGNTLIVEKKGEDL